MSAPRFADVDLGNPKNEAQVLLAYLFGGNRAGGANLWPPHRRQGTPKRARKPDADRLRLGSEFGRLAFVTPSFGVKNAMRRGTTPVEVSEPEKYLHRHHRVMRAIWTAVWEKYPDGIIRAAA